MSRRRQRIQGHKADMLDALAAEAELWELPEGAGPEWLDARDELVRQVHTADPLAPARLLTHRWQQVRGVMPAHYIADTRQQMLDALEPIYRAAVGTALQPTVDAIRAVTDSFLPAPAASPPELPLPDDPPAVLRSKARAALKARHAGGHGPQRKLLEPREVRR